MKNIAIFILFVFFCSVTVGIIFLNVFFGDSIISLCFNLPWLLAVYYSYKVEGFRGVGKLLALYWVIILIIISFVSLVGYMGPSEDERWCKGGITGNFTYITNEHGEEVKTIIVCENGKLVNKIII